ncbi:hypothetical protein IKG10_03090 [Candidatus Saccharibacteria bacterium]|nr:hypothetical protein [Candidatus Saccharibacteria bacterium]
MKWFMRQKKDKKNQHQSKLLMILIILLGVAIPIFSTALITSSNAWAEDKYFDGMPENCNGDWKLDSEAGTISCDDPKVSHKINGVKTAPTCESGWKKTLDVGISTTTGNKQYNQYSCDNPKMTIDTTTDVAPNYSASKSDSEILQCYDIQTASGDGYYCVGAKVGALHPGGVSEEEKEKTEEEAREYLEKNECKKQAGALGWILCPIVKGIGESLANVYENIVEPFLVIEPSLISNSDKNGTFLAWDIFRNIANWMFVIILLAVIFSQITGVGINNYGIKKIIPKLIVMAIVVNLSYLICQLAVDLSNILGSGLNAMFSGIASQVDANATSSAAYFSGLIKVVSAAVGVVAGIATAGTVAFVAISVITGGWSIIVPVLLGLMSAFLSVMFMFVVLFVRQALVVLLVAVSPVAFVLYALPNTKKIFDRWLSAFKGVLLLYPLAGALIGGGLLASVIIVTASANAAASANAGSDQLQLLFLYIGGMLLQVVPFFFLPTLFKKSLNAVGDIGNKISGFGRGLGASINKGVRENEGVREWQAKMAAGKPGGIRQSIASKLPGPLGRNQFARNRMKYDRMLARQGAYDAMYGENYALETETANEMRRIVSSGEIDNADGMREQLTEAILNEDKAKIRAYTDALATKGSYGGNAVKEAWNNAVTKANSGSDSRTISDVAASTFANNILSPKNGANFKDNRRSMFDVAQGINLAMSKPLNGTEAEKAAVRAERDAAKGQTTDSYIGANKTNLVKNVNATTIGSMDDEEFRAIFGDGTIPEGLNEEEANGLRDVARRALSDSNAARLDAARVAALKNIVDDTNASALSDENGKPIRSGKPPMILS